MVVLCYYFCQEIGVFCLHRFQLTNLCSVTHKNASKIDGFRVLLNESLSTAFETQKIGIRGGVKMEWLQEPSVTTRSYFSESCSPPSGLQPTVSCPCVSKGTCILNGWCLVN